MENAINVSGDIVANLLSMPFKEKLKLIGKGRPEPEHNLVQKAKAFASISTPEIISDSPG